MRRRYGLVAALAVILAGCSTGQPGDSASGLTKISYAILSPSASFAPELLMGSEPQMCAPYGVAPSITVLNAAAAGPALAAGQIQAVRDGTGAVLATASKNPAGIKIAATVGNAPYFLWGAKEIRSIGDLKGQTVGASASGAVADLVMRETLSENGLQPGTDVKITYGGSASSLFGLAASGAIKGLVYPEPLPATVTAAGVHKIAEVSADPRIAPILSTVIAVSARVATGQREAVTGLLRCLAAASQLALRGDQRVVAALAKAAKIDEPTAAAQLAGVRAAGTFALAPLTAGDARAVMAVLEKQGVQRFGPFDPSEVIDDSLLPRS
ncbi:ABC transporter substrate-binding protein [Amycolatopsis pithecellobii]|uniref:PhnD/SsuA/transferrin family substrate-binding protein n=1 Tax=Amycolatopsis pithecellobii TaxID=664692 RepID=A0A6N7Z0K0_9PSEU|nr:ABC transporter substrate-binding protein [Amycolatopsis pithecellobii]MTD53120.1 PhnD/SsuA/transferrin family substrate-binding protein [Amycolatopsis pithecellobii]